MYNKIIVIVFLCTLQYLNARAPPPESPIREAIQGINPELNKLTARLKELKLDLLKASLQNQIQGQKSSLEPIENLLLKIENLDLKVIEIKEINSDQDVDKCIDSLNGKIERILTVARSKTIQNLHKNNLQSGNDTQSVDAVINKATDIERNMNKLIGYCIRQNSLSWQKGRLKSCLNNETALLNTVVDKLYAEKDAISSLRNTTTRDGLSKWFSKIEEQFNSCISTALVQGESKSVTENLDRTEAKDEGNETETSSDFPKISVEEHELRIINRIKNIKDLIQHYVEQCQIKEENLSSGPVVNLSSDVVPKKEKFILFISV